jgi:structural maintenance of chromosome 4
MTRTQSKPDTGDVSCITSLEREIATAQSELESSRLLEQKSKVDGLKLHINLTNDEITKAEVMKAKAERDFCQA